MDGTGETRESDAPVRVATAADVAWLLDLAADEGWNPGLDDLDAFRRADPGGFLVALEGDSPVAGLSVVRHDDAHAFLGLYLCRPDARGRGHGWRVWQAGLAHAGSRGVGLDGVPAQQANYRLSGFVPAWRNLRFEGAPPPTSPESLDLPSPRPARAADLDDLLALDRRVGGIRRDAFARGWFADTATRRTLLCRSGGETVAAGTIRACREHHKVGPLFADSPALARHLLAALGREAAATRLVVDVPEGNGTALRLCESLGLGPVFETARMYRGAPPAVDLGRLYGIATLELG